MIEPASCGRRFSANFEMCDLDEQLRPGPVWSARSVSISRSRLWLRSRRMCYVGTRVATVLHRIDSEPVVIVGIVSRCEYDTNSMYDLELSFEPSPGQFVLDEIRHRISTGLAA